MKTEAQREYARNYYHTKLKNNEDFKVKSRQKSRESQRKKKETLHSLVREFRVNGCLICQEQDPSCLQAHHIDPEQKDFSISRARKLGATEDRIRGELAKCVCLCANCHFKVHAGRLSLPG